MNTITVGHTVKIARNGDHVIAEPKTLVVKKGDTLQIGSTDGMFRVKFVPWPFAEKNEAGEVANKDKVLTFDTICDFSFFCFLTPHGETRELAYPKGPGGDADGGHGNVHP